MSENDARPFFGAGLVWLAVMEALVWKFTPNPHFLRAAFAWATALWALCLLDLFVLAKLVNAAILLVSGLHRRTRSRMMVETFYWSALKLACLGALIFSVAWGKQIPVTGLLPGVATLFVVPVMGGMIWGLRTFRYGRAFI